MLRAQALTLSLSFNHLQARLPPAPTTLGLVEQFTSMDLDTLLSISCVLWASTPDRRQEGYRLLDRALTLVSYPVKGQPTGLATALDHCGWNAPFQGQPSKALQRLLDHAFPCQYREGPASPGRWQCTGECHSRWHRVPDAYYLDLALTALLQPEQRETIAEKVVDPPRRRRR
jgi:hypothetical protein